MASFALFSVLCANAQKTVSGRIYDESNKEPIDNVLCRLLSKDKNKDKDGRFSFSDGTGLFRFDYNNPETDSIQFSLLGYQETTIPIHVILNAPNVYLSPKETHLQEIIVSAPPIRENGDTLMYNVSSFISQNDKYIADILKKLPGITVNDNGSINYQGEAINKFYIEGRDLFGANYSLASDNLDVNAVGSVEIIEHNQHIKSLNGIENSNRAAINLKLKNKFMIRPFGEMNLGLGIKNLYHIDFITSLLTKETQAFFSAKANNSGGNIISELDDKLDVSAVQTYVPPYTNIFGNVSFQTPPLALSRYKFNKTFTGSGNILVPISKISELKLNIACGKDNSDMEYDMRRSLMLGDNHILKLFENTTGQVKSDKFKLLSAYELNSSRTFLKEEIGFLSYKNRNRAFLYTPIDSINSLTDAEPCVLRNSLDFIYRTKSDNIIRVQSNSHFGKAAEYMENNYNAYKNPIYENLTNKYIITKNVFGTGFPVLNHRVGIEGAVNYSNKLYNMHSITHEFTDSIPEFSKSHRTICQYGILPNINFRWLDNAINLTIKGDTWYYSHEGREKDTRHKRTIFLPSLATSFNITHKLETRLNLNKNFDYIDGISLLDNPFFQTYRSIYIPSHTVNYRSGYSVFYTLKYKDIPNLLFGNFNCIYRKFHSNYTPESYNTQNWSVLTYLTRPSNFSMFRIQAEINKNFSTTRTTMVISPIYTRHYSEVIQQNIFAKNIHSIYELKVNISNHNLRWLYVDYCFSGKLLKNKNTFTSYKPLLHFNQIAKLSIYPIKNFKIETSGECHNLEHPNGFHNTFFCDMDMSYDFKRFGLSFNASNIFNIKEYIIAEYSSVNEYNQSFAIRGIEILISLRFKF